jgi:hypothetical protein
MWSRADKANIMAEIRAIRTTSNPLSVELDRVLAYVCQVAKDGLKMLNQNIHGHPIAGRNLYSACPFGVVGVYYAYETPPATVLYLLNFSQNLHIDYSVAVARLANVP